MLFTSSSFISCYQVTGNQINIAQCLAAKFFNVYPGRYRCMPVAVKRVRTMEQWTKDVFWVFLHEVETIRSATAMSVSQSVCLSVSLSISVCWSVQEQAKMSLKVCLPLVCSLPVCHQSSLFLSSVLHLFISILCLPPFPHILVNSSVPVWCSFLVRPLTANKKHVPSSQSTWPEGAWTLYCT